MSGSHKELEEGNRLQLDFSKLAKVAACGQEVVPVVVQCAETGQVLILAYANQLALEESRKRGLAVFWSTSRNELWVKGVSSGDTLKLTEIRVNCEQNSILYLVVRSRQGSCHTRKSNGQSRSGCYYRRIADDGQLENLEP